MTGRAARICCRAKQLLRPRRAGRSEGARAGQEDAQEGHAARGRRREHEGMARVRRGELKAERVPAAPSLVLPFESASAARRFILRAPRSSRCSRGACLGSTRRPARRTAAAEPSTGPTEGRADDPRPTSAYPESRTPEKAENTAKTCKVGHAHASVAGSVHPPTSAQTPTTQSQTISHAQSHNGIP